MARIRWRPWGRSHFLASVRSAWFGWRKNKSHCFSWNYQARHFRCHSKSTPSQHGFGQCATSKACTRPLGRLPSVARSLAKSQASPLGRTCAERGCTTHCWTWTRDTSIQKRALLPHQRNFQYRKCRGNSGGESRIRQAFPYPWRSTCFLREMQRRTVHSGQHCTQAPQTHTSPSLYHLHAATRGSTKVGIYGGTNHDDSATSVRKRIDYLHAYRQRQPVIARYQYQQRRNHKGLWQGIQ